MYWTPIYSPDRTPRIKNMRFTLWGIIRCSLVGQQRKKKNHICGTHTWKKLQKSLYPGVFEMWMDQRNRTKVEVVLDHLLQWWQAGKGLRLYENSKLNRGILQTKIVHTHIHDLPPKHIRINPWPTLRLSIALFPVVMASLYHPRSSAKSHRGPYPTLKPQALLTRSDTIGRSVKLLVKVKLAGSNKEGRTVRRSVRPSREYKGTALCLWWTLGVGRAYIFPFGLRTVTVGPSALCCIPSFLGVLAVGTMW